MVKKAEGRVSNGEGSIRQRPDGTYEIRVSVQNALGQRKRVSLYGKTRREVVAKRDAIKREEASGTFASSNAYTVETYLKLWLEQSQNQYKPSTYESYCWMVEQRINPHIGHVPLTKLTPLHVNGLIKAIQDSGLRNRSAINARAILHRALAQAVQWGLVGRNVAEAINPPKPDTQPRTVWTAAEAKKFLQTCQGHPLEALFLLALTTGMRKGELLGLRWTDIDEQHSQVSIRQNIVAAAGKLVTTTPKTRTSTRTVLISSDVLAALKAHKETQALTKAAAGELWHDLDLVFTTNIGTTIGNNLQKIWYELRAQAGVSAIRFHDLRHTYASVAASRKHISPQAISDRLGHHSVAFTLQTYVHLFDEERKRSVHTAATLFDDDEPPSKTNTPNAS